MSGRFTLANASQWPTSEVRDLVRRATRDVDMSGVHVNVHPCRGDRYHGHAYNGVPSISNAPAGTRYLVTLRISPDLTFPAHPSKRRRGEPPFCLNDWRETFVFVAAHEAKHIEQFREDLSRSEVRCNVFAYHVLQAYRDDLTSATAVA